MRPSVRQACTLYCHLTHIIRNQIFMYPRCPGYILICCSLYRTCFKFVFSFFPVSKAVLRHRMSKWNRLCGIFFLTLQEKKKGLIKTIACSNLLFVIIKSDNVALAKVHTDFFPLPWDVAIFQHQVITLAYSLSFQTEIPRCWPTAFLSKLKYNIGLF